MLEVASGRPTAAERLGHREFAIHRRNPTIWIGSGRLGRSTIGHAAVAANRPCRRGRVGRFRWTICGLLFLAATINYVDRQVIGILKPTLQAQFGWTEIDYGDIVFAFQLAYAIGFLFAGRVMDRLGIKRGFALALIDLVARRDGARRSRRGSAPRPRCCSARSASPTRRRSPASSSSRFLLGLGESGNFPAAIKTVAEWFPQRERAFATGLFNAGTNIGARRSRR